MLASLNKPSENNSSNIEYVRKAASSQDQTFKPEWGDGDVVYLTIRVTDTGRGLSSSEKSNLFTMFQQASPKTHVQYGGSGLGLFISRQLTEMQGGEIGVASEPQLGSTFEFYVKGRRANTPEKNELMPKRNDLQLLVRGDVLREACGEAEISVPNKSIQLPSDSPVIEPPASPFPFRGKARKSFKILVVEDNLVNQKVVTKQLRRAGHVVSVANHGLEAIEFIQKTNYWRRESTSPSRNRDSLNGLDYKQVEENETLSSAQRLDVVLMDLEMPIMDGLTCVRWLRDSQRKGKISGHIPVIAVTANARKDQILTYFEAGMVSSIIFFTYLAKVSPGCFIDSITG
jgi:CheY-like chemotaxis protein